MKTKNKFYLILLVVAAFSLSACTKFLDEMPDNRTELDSEDKILAMLVSAYTDNPYIVVSEYSSDNVDELAHISNPRFDVYTEELYFWKDVTQKDNEDPSFVWSALYGAIAAANQALEGIEQMGGPNTPKLQAAMGEALVARAYSHFMLVNLFCQGYNPQYAESDLGIPYMEQAETELNPKYERGTVAEVYAKIEQDLINGLPLVNDAFYSVPKYHFNTKAAYGFAARFYLFYQKWEEAIKCADVVLGGDPSAMMRNMAYLASLPQETATGDSQHAIEYSSASNKCNLLLSTGISQLCLTFCWYYKNDRYNHGRLLSTGETCNASNPWSSGVSNWYEKPFTAANQNIDKTAFTRFPMFFEYSDPVAQIGYRRTVYPALTAEEVLLTRAEANIMLKQNGEALADMNIWVRAQVKPGSFTSLTEASVNAWANGIRYYTPFAPTPKKAFDEPAFGVSSGTQENMCHALLYMRRIETLHMGLRLFDVKRYGITVSRRKLSGISSVGMVTDVLRPRDPRCAIQLPDDVIAAGLQPNPR